MSLLGLKVDVCTYEGLRRGVPHLLRLFAAYDLRISFFVAMGPDTSGRAIFQILRPGFLAKMRRTRAVATYGWRTLLAGTLLPPRHMGRQLAPILRDILAAGHELAVHGYNHRRWQDGLQRMEPEQVREEIRRAVAVCQEAGGPAPRGFGAPGWQVSPASLRLLDEAGFQYASDARGTRPFFPRVAGMRLKTLQLPTTFPTLDEVLGLDGMDGQDFAALVRRELPARPWNVLTLHAEMEGMRCQGTLGRLLDGFCEDGVTCVRLDALAAEILAAAGSGPPATEVVARALRGRAGTVAMPAGFEVS